LPHWPKTALGGDPGGQRTETVQTSGSGTLADESVSITVMPDGAAASTLQVSVEVDYRLPRPKAELVPDSGILTATLQPASGGTLGAASTRRITSRSTIARIAADINALPTVAEGPVYGCPEIVASTTLTLDFAPTASAPPAASTLVEVPIAPTAICRPGMQVTVDGVREPDLDDSAHAGLFTELERLTGFAR
jgi:hypothetical protein